MEPDSAREDVGKATRYHFTFSAKGDAAGMGKLNEFEILISLFRQ
jgi:hypothetical protein